MQNTLSCRLVAAVVVALSAWVPAQEKSARRPNILFAIADDWGWPHAGSYGDAVVETKTFDRIARDGVLFRHAYVSSPSCTPSRGAILTGQYHWRLETGANLYGSFRDEFATYVELLEKAGYVGGSSGKAWGPGRPQTRGRQLAGKRCKNFGAFMASRSSDAPFVYWLGTSDPHRPYKRHSGAKSGMDLAKVHLFGHYPDTREIRGDVADYYFEVQRFDRLVGNALRALEKAGELENTLVVMTGDHGMPFPRGKSNLYDAGTRVPLAVMWGAGVKPARASEAFVSLTDLAPTFLQAAGVEIPKAMTGRSLLNLLAGKADGTVRDHVVFGKERHVPSQEAPDLGGYPGRAIRTARYLYIRNFEPDRWPNGTPNFEKAVRPGYWYADTDNGPTKTYIVDNRDKDDLHRRAYELCFAKRPAEELYDVTSDPDQLRNLAGDPALQEVKANLWQRLESKLRESGDPRVVGGAEKFDRFPYSGGGPKHPSWRKARRRKDASPFPVAEAKSVGLSQEKLDTLVERMESWVKSGLVVGVELLVIKNRKTVLHEARGWRDRERKLPMVRNTICRIRSMTKPLMGTAIHMLAAEKKLALADPVAKFLPSFANERSRGITIDQLLKHESGFVQNGFPKSLRTYPNLRAAVDASGKMGPQNPVGAEFRYSDVNSATLGALVAELSGMPAEEFLQKRILGPLGMQDSFCMLTDKRPRRSRLSSTYVLGKKGLQKYWDNRQPPEYAFFRGCGGVYSTTSDYARFLAMWMDSGRVGQQRFLSEATVRDALTPSKLSSKGWLVIKSYARQWEIFKRFPDRKHPAGPKALPVFSHGGSDGTIAIADPHRDLIVCYFTQSRRGKTMNMFAPLIWATLQ